MIGICPGQYAGHSGSIYPVSGANLDAYPVGTGIRTWVLLLLLK